MKKRAMFRLACALLLVLALASALKAAGQGLAPAAGPFDLSWWTIDGGGGASSGGAYELAGTSGQPDAGVLTGGGYGLTGGFWGGASAPNASYLPMILR
jgi:hypothetical protein